MPFPPTVSFSDLISPITLHEPKRDRRQTGSHKVKRSHRNRLPTTTKTG